MISVVSASEVAVVDVSIIKDLIRCSMTEVWVTVYSWGGWCRTNAHNKLRA